MSEKQVNSDSGSLSVAASEIRQRRPQLPIRILAASGWCAILGTLAAQFADLHWIADALSQFRVQYAILAIPAGILFIFRRHWKTAIGCAVVFLLNMSWIVPYFLPGIPTPDSEKMRETWRLVSFNLLRTNTDFQSTIAAVDEENPDFVFLMEVHSNWKPHFESLLDRFPHQQAVYDNGYVGVAFLSKHPWDKLDVIYSGVIANPSIDITFQHRLGLSRPLRIIATHPVPPFGAELTRSREEQLIGLAKRLNLAINKVEREIVNRSTASDPDLQASSASLLIGDFNLTPWSPSFARILDAGSLSDAARGYGISPTLAPLPTVLGGLKVDHVLRNQFIQAKEFRVEAVAGSDHHLLILDFGIAQ